MNARTYELHFPYTNRIKSVQWNKPVKRIVLITTGIVSGIGFVVFGP